MNYMWYEVRRRGDCFVREGISKMRVRGYIVRGKWIRINCNGIC